MRPTLRSGKCPENITGRDTLEMTWRTRRAFQSGKLELVEFLHPRQENVHFSNGFGLSCFYVQLKGKKSWRSAILATSIISFWTTPPRPGWLHIRAVSPLGWPLRNSPTHHPPLTSSMCVAHLGLKTTGSSGSGAREKHLESLPTRTLESQCGWSWSTSWVHCVANIEAWVASSLCVLLFFIYFWADVSVPLKGDGNHTVGSGELGMTFGISLLY